MTSSDDIISALPDGVLLASAQGVITAANATACDLLQMEVKGLAIGSVIRSELFAEAFAEAGHGGRPVSVEIEFHGRPSRQVVAHISPLDEAGNRLVLLRDLTREQAIERMRSDFIANASHEMRTPLSSIIGAIETLQGAARNDPKAQSLFLTTMLSQALRMKRLIDDLLTLSRIELNEHVKPNAQVQLRDIALQAKANLRELAKEFKIEVRVTGSAHVLVAGDADELLQVAQNLLENAIKYGGNGGLVEMTCTTSEGDGLLSVSDDGQGIAEIHLPRLTERFYRVNTQESRARGGTGLGLAIVKHIVLRHRGKLTISSEKGKGSRFAVSIPLHISKS